MGIRAEEKITHIDHKLNRKYAVADPGFPLMGEDTHRGDQLPMWLHFIKCVCQKQGIGTLRALGSLWIRQ